MGDRDSDPQASVTAGVAHQRVHVALPPPEAFRLFTDGIQEWWPLEEGYSYAGPRVKEIHLEARVGGRFFERFVDGDEFEVGRVRVCEPPDRILFTWRDPDWSADTEVEVTFAAEGDGTRVSLSHRGFDRLGPDWEAIAARWASGWPRVIEAFTQRGSHQ
jgi:uncharacterized protein YndB with AHSA1/START domain